MHPRGMPLRAIGRAACFKASITPRHLLQSVMEISALIVPESGGGCPFKTSLAGKEFAACVELKSRESTYQEHKLTIYGADAELFLCLVAKRAGAMSHA